MARFAILLAVFLILANANPLQLAEDGGRDADIIGPHMRCGTYVTLFHPENLPMIGIPLRGGIIIRESAPEISDNSAISSDESVFSSADSSESIKALLDLVEFSQVTQRILPSLLDFLLPSGEYSGEFEKELKFSKEPENMKTISSVDAETPEIKMHGSSHVSDLPLPSLFDFFLPSGEYSGEFEKEFPKVEKEFLMKLEKENLFSKEPEDMEIVSFEDAVIPEIIVDDSLNVSDLPLPSLFNFLFSSGKHFGEIENGPKFAVEPVNTENEEYFEPERAVTPEVVSNSDEPVTFSSSDWSEFPSEEIKLNDMAPSEYSPSEYSDVEYSFRIVSFISSTICLLAPLAVLAFIIGIVLSYLKEAPAGNVMVVNMPDVKSPLLQTYEEGYKNRENNGEDMENAGVVPYVALDAPKN